MTEFKKSNFKLIEDLEKNLILRNPLVCSTKWLNNKVAFNT
ncbi:hypothetical protein EZS27_000536 [termite gut metagenome]|uniref:Uncharacterized protein n=1 Tax=termite gut metagenome TaxID=433724 RepID=A0A5J4T1J5_9ZZZZ